MPTGDAGGTAADGGETAASGDGGGGRGHCPRPTDVFDVSVTEWGLPTDPAHLYDRGDGGGDSGSDGDGDGDGAGTALCGTRGTADADRAPLTDHADRVAALGWHRVCGNCARVARRRVRDGELASGHRQYDLALRARPGDEVAVKTPRCDYRLVVEEVQFRHGAATIEGHAADPDLDGATHPSNRMSVGVLPDGSVRRVALPHDLVADRPTAETATLRRPTDGGA